MITDVPLYFDKARVWEIFSPSAGMSSVSASESASQSDVSINCIDGNAAAFMCNSGAVESAPFGLKDRVTINSDTPFEFENEYFVGRIAILHREPIDYPFDYRYDEFFKTKKRRWELRWQGKFKQQFDEPIVFGAEMSSPNAPKMGFASKAFMSLLIKFSQSLARARGSDLFTNVIEEVIPPEVPKYFRFPIHTSDLILSTPPGSEPPSITEPSDMRASGSHTVCANLFKDPKNLPLDNTYTFVFYSMYIDFVSWDLQNVPLGLSGMSLNRIVGSQPMSVLMRQGDKILFRIVMGNKCTSPDWASFLATGQPFDFDKMTDFFSISSFYSGIADPADIPNSPRGRRWGVPRLPRRAPRPTSPRKHKKQFWLWRGFRKLVIAPTKYIGTCLRAPVSFVINSQSRKVPPKKIIRHPAPVPDKPPVFHSANDGAEFHSAGEDTP